MGFHFKSGGNCAGGSSDRHAWPRHAPAILQRRQLCDGYRSLAPGHLLVEGQCRARGLDAVGCDAVGGLGARAG